MNLLMTLFRKSLNLEPGLIKMLLGWSDCHYLPILGLLRTPFGLPRNDKSPVIARRLRRSRRGNLRLGLHGGCIGGGVSGCSCVSEIASLRPVTRVTWHSADVP